MEYLVSSTFIRQRGENRETISFTLGAASWNLILFARCNVIDLMRLIKVIVIRISIEDNFYTSSFSFSFFEYIVIYRKREIFTNDFIIWKI